MASWGFHCKNCGRAFVHEEIKDSFRNYYWPSKPEIPKEGLLRKCPHCSAEFTYMLEDLRYQRASAGTSL